MTKYRILIETITYRAFDPTPPRQYNYGTAVSHQLIEFETKAEADVAFSIVNNEGNGALGFQRLVWRLYRN